MTISSFRARGKWSTRLLVAIFLSAAAFYLLTSLFTIVNFAWRQPMFDQWRMYVTLLSLPFPQDVLQLENGHRPIIPNLIRIAEIHWFGANQLLQISIGTSCALLTSGIVAFGLAKDRDLPVPTRAAGVMLAVIGIFWLANARMLMHGHEALHAYLVALMVVSAGLCTWKASSGAPLRWLGAASLACAIAMFSFGPGVASFPAILALGATLRLRWRHLLVPLAVFLLCLALYLLVLPGNQGVRNVLDFRPLASLVTTAQWLASPWVNAWLGVADPPLLSWLPASMQTSATGRILIGLANALTSHYGIAWQSVAAVIGCAGIALFLLRIGIFYRRRTALSQTQAVAIALCLFVLATAAMIGIARLDYLAAYPGQNYADRYLMWPCLFWMGLTLLLLIDVSKFRTRIVAMAGLLLLIALPIALLPTHRAWAGWAAVVYQRSQQIAATARSDVFDPVLFPNGADATRSEVLQTLALLKKDRLAMFVKPGWAKLGTHIEVRLEHNPNLDAQAHILSTFIDPLSGLPAARVEGVIKHGISEVHSDDEWAILDSANRIVGFAEFSFINHDAHALRLDVPRKRGFNGYIRDYKFGQRYDLALIATAHGYADLLNNIPSS